ncbi:MAG: alginate lyase family protein [Pseudomonadota bacterium]
MELDRSSLAASAALVGRAPRAAGDIAGPFPWVLAILLLAVTASGAHAEVAEHPRLAMSKAGVQLMREGLGQTPLFDASLARVQAEVDAEIALGIDTPVPHDLSGGYTHERHKRNFLLMPKAGALYQLLDDARYAVFLRDMFLQYEAMYGALPLHPQERSYARGKLFWQCLNDANWLLYASLGYDAIYDYLSAAERERLETNLFRPFADFLSLDNPQFFNRIHNHSTWGTAAVGMIGLVMDDEALVRRALYGLDVGKFDAEARDNDGGFIRQPGQAAGFLANLDEAFSPDGYYTEGPYYQRYAMYPFLIFAQGLANARPELGIMGYKDGVLLKAITTLINLTDADGEFFPLNDAQKGMSWLSESVVAAVDIAYQSGAHDPQLLTIARQQHRVTLDEAGFAVARDLRDGLAEPLVRASVNYTDGAQGTAGGLAVLRAPAAPLTLVFKYSAQGLSHGHYDKLAFSLYAEGQEVLQDYGMVRFVNIGQKGGGNYLPENASWAKQTIAHNTLVQDETSHFEGRYEIGSQRHAELAFFDASDPAAQVISATVRTAYPGTVLRRTMALVQVAEQPVVIDLLRVESDAAHRYDLPFWFIGQHLTTDVPIASPEAREILGVDHGYQHLLVEARGAPAEANARFQWLVGGSFYTLTAAVQGGDEWVFTRLGANDPAFNLRRDAGLIIRRDADESTLFASVIEAHGHYSPVSELTVDPMGRVAQLSVAHDDGQYSAVILVSQDEPEHVLIVANDDTSATATHSLTLGTQRFQWRGPYLYR